MWRAAAHAALRRHLLACSFPKQQKKEEHKKKKLPSLPTSLREFKKLKEQHVIGEGKSESQKKENEEAAARKAQEKVSSSVHVPDINYKFA
jgi:hypothetical protein